MADTSQFRKNLQESIIQADTIKLFDNLLTIAVEEDASDIHIEPWNLKLFNLLDHIYSKRSVRGEDLEHRFVLDPGDLKEFFAEMTN